MEFLKRADATPERLGILPGTFNPVTVAHLALARAALGQVDEVVFVLPQLLPHKDYSGVSFSERLEILREATGGEPRWSVASSRGGLFLDIARECREHYGEGVQLTFLCGRDAAERIATWDYGKPNAFPESLREFDLLVASRSGAYEPSPDIAAAVRRLEMSCDFDAVSATEIRERIAAGLPWEHLVPEAVRDRVRQAYRP